MVPFPLGRNGLSTTVIYQPASILGPVLSILFKLHSVSAHEPVADDEGLIDDSSSTAKHVLESAVGEMIASI